jgi:transcriptional regulator with XRE-family HTH domain
MHFLGKNLRHLRKQTSKTQSEIASLIQKGQTTVGNWENGISEPNLNELLIISNYFDIPVDKLLKTDLSEDQATFKAGIGRPYDHSGGIELSTVREKDENLTYVLREIQDIRSEMQQIYARLPARSDATDGEQ